MTCLLATALVFSLAACNDKEQDGVDPNAPMHEQLTAEADINLGYARQAANMGVPIQGEYYCGLALAEVSALRLCADNILWLKGEGETVDEIIGAAPYSDWNDVVAAGLGSPMPFYFEGLLFKVQGKDAEAEVCYKTALRNPITGSQRIHSKTIGSARSTGSNSWWSQVRTAAPLTDACARRMASPRDMR
jgi:hypothetical protein